MKSNSSALAVFTTGKTKDKRVPRRRKPKAPPWRRWIKSTLAWIAAHRLKPTPRRLHLRETISFGEKRFAAVVEFEDRWFLVGGAATSVSLLAELQPASFADALSEKTSVLPEAK
jgi:hypothetical protein